MQSGNYREPSLTQTISNPHRQAETLISVENILVAAVTYLISDERRANINNKIKQEINWHQAANCLKNPKVIAHRACRLLKHNSYYQCYELLVNLFHIYITAKPLYKMVQC